MIGTRYRLVSTQGEHEHVSSVVMSREEALEHLDIEAELHEQTGWDVDRIVSGRGDLEFILCRRGRINRRLTIRGFSPLEDV